jgi:hypothetical protein
VKISQACKIKQRVGQNPQSLLWALLLQVFGAFSINPELLKLLLPTKLLVAGLPSSHFYITHKKTL